MWTVELEDSLDHGVIYLAYRQNQNEKTRRPVSFKRGSYDTLYLQRRDSSSVIWFPMAGFVPERGYVKLENEP